MKKIDEVLSYIGAVVVGVLIGTGLLSVIMVAVEMMAKQ